MSALTEPTRSVPSSRDTRKPPKGRNPSYRPLTPSEIPYSVHEISSSTSASTGVGPLQLAVHTIT